MAAGEIFDFHKARMAQREFAANQLCSGLEGLGWAVGALVPDGFPCNAFNSGSRLLLPSGFSTSSIVGELSAISST